MNGRLPACIGILAFAAGGPSLAAGNRPCSALAVASDAKVHARWPDLADHLRVVFAARADVDSCARIRLTMPARAMVVEVVLPDGRSASRLVSRPEDVVATLQALLLVPDEPEAPDLPREPEESEASRPAAKPRPVSAPAPAPTRAGVAASDRAAAVTPPAPALGGLGIELSVLAGTRIGDGQTGAGLGVLTFLDAGGWLLGFSGRADVYQTFQGGPSSGGLVLGLLGGHRFRSGTLALDLMAGPAVAMLGTTVSVTQMAPAVPPITESTSMGTSRRLLAGARLNFRARSVLRTFIGVDGELGSAAPRPRPFSEIAALPTWTVGLLLGATVGTP